jgi:integral membrane protein
MIDLFKTQIGRFKIIAFTEGVSFLLILSVTMPLKYLWDMPEPNKIIGMVHGLLFILYILAVIQIKYTTDWSNRNMLLALLGSIIPFGTFYVTARLLPEPQNP